ncbi:hypothetical protein ACIQVR_26975 [Streptomyces xanthochromogenes]|uniref:hypothetical protein n=1 Tax=Streptomyces xanthochromogenes TaxID=67384 RepID=UPI003815E9F6
MNTLLVMPGLAILLIVFTAALATIGLAYLLPDLIGRRPKPRDSKHVRPAAGSHVLLAKPNLYVERWFGVLPGSVGIIVGSSRGHDGTGVLVHWLTKPDDLVHQDLVALEIAGASAVFHELDELAFFAPRPTVRTRHSPLLKEY